MGEETRGRRSTRCDF